MVLADSFGDISFGSFLLVVAIAAGLATLVFRHAHRRGNKHATAWGVFTFLFAALAIPLYVINYWLTRNRQ
jgi:dolichol kinase